MPEEKLQTLSLQVINGSELESGRAALSVHTAGKCRPCPRMPLVGTGSSAEHSGPGFYRYPARWHILSTPADGTTVAESGKSHSNIRPDTVAPGR